MPFLQRPDCDIYYETHGQGPAVLLTHGFSLTSEMWAPQIKSLSQDHRLIMWDIRGHGQSGQPNKDTAFGRSHCLADMSALLDHLECDEAVIAGLSLGGYLSLAFCAVFPARARGMMIFNTGPGYRSVNAREDWNKTAHSQMDDIEIKGVDALEYAPGRFSHRDLVGVARAGRQLVVQQDADVINALPGLKLPSLVLVGADDTPFLGPTDYMVYKIRGAQKAVIPDAGHLSNLDQPDLFNKAVLGFLSGI